MIGSNHRDIDEDHAEPVLLAYTPRGLKVLRPTAIALCLLVVACYEEPVRDHLHIAFGPGPIIVVTAVRDIASPDVAGDNRAVEERLEEARTDLSSGWDRWSRSFSELGAVADRSTLERDEGRVRRGIHSALVDSFRPIERLLGDEGLGAFYDEADGRRELQLYPTGAGQASRQQRELVDQFLAVWSEDIVEYLHTTGTLYAYLEERPERAVPCFAHIFDDQPESSGPLDGHEAELVQWVKSRTEKVADVLLIVPDQAYSVNELSRLAFDSFQGRLTLSLDGPILECDGFAEHSTFVERPPVDLWRALESLAGRWLTPDLVTALAAPGPAEAQPDTDPESFATLPRRWSPPPDPWAVEAEIRGRLQPEEVYRVSWRTRAVPDEDELIGLAVTMLADAERNLPD